MTHSFYSAESDTTIADYVAAAGGTYHAPANVNAPFGPVDAATHPNVSVDFAADQRQRLRDATWGHYVSYPPAEASLNNREQIPCELITIYIKSTSSMYWRLLGHDSVPAPPQESDVTFKHWTMFDTFVTVLTNRVIQNRLIPSDLETLAYCLNSLYAHRDYFRSCLLDGTLTLPFDEGFEPVVMTPDDAWK